MPNFYIRYVDDCLAVFYSEQQADDFLQDLNSISPEIQFTMEKAKNKAINFLDMTVLLEGNSFKTKWYIKPTNTGLYIPNISYCPNSYKANTISNLYQRSERLSDDPADKAGNVKIIKAMFLENGYHPNFIDKCIEKKKTNPDSKEKKTL